MSEEQKTVFEKNREAANQALHAIEKIDSKSLGIKASSLPTLRCWLREIIQQCDEQIGEPS